MLIQFYDLKNDQFFEWRGDIYQKVRDTFEEGPLKRLTGGVAKVIAFKARFEWQLYSHQTETKFNPYCDVQPVDAKFNPI